MAENQRRSAFRLPWSDSGEQARSEPAAADAAAPDAGAGDPPAAEQRATAPAAPVTDPAPPPQPPAPGPDPTRAESSLFLRELVDAMRGVAESSRETNLSELRASLDVRIDELRVRAEQRAEELRHRSEQDITGVGEWERSEIERIRSEAEQRRDARRAKLEQELAEHQAAADREVEASRRRVAEYERQLASFFAELTEIADPAAFVAAAKRMPPPPELGAGTPGSPGAEVAPSGEREAPTPEGTPSEGSLSERLAQLDERLGSAAGASSEDSGTSETATAIAEAAPPAAAEPPPGPSGAGSERSTPIVVKGLGSFGAITSFKQALERVDGVHGVTLSLGPTGEFVYRANHAAEFDIEGAIRQIEGPGAGIEQAEGSVLVTLERQR